MQMSHKIMEYVKCAHTKLILHVENCASCFPVCPSLPCDPAGGNARWGHSTWPVGWKQMKSGVGQHLSVELFSPPGPRLAGLHHCFCKLWCCGDSMGDDQMLQTTSLMLSASPGAEARQFRNPNHFLANASFMAPEAPQIDSVGRRGWEGGILLFKLEKENNTPK